MNKTHQLHSSGTAARGLVQAGASLAPPRPAGLILSIILCAGLTGCSFLKPAKSTARHFVLTSIPAGEPAPAASGAIALGVGQVKLPAYLFNTSLAIRKGANEIQYLPSAIWAERLDAGFQRVLAANLALILPTDRIHLSAWQRGDVTAELYITIEQFDVDAGGRGVLVARWRLVSSDGERLLQAGSSRLALQGAAPDSGAAGAIATLSELVANFSRALARVLQETAPARPAAMVPGLTPDAK